MELEKCPFCGENNASLLYFNVEEQETYCIDTDEELDSKNIVGYVHCDGCDIDFYADITLTPREVMEKWNSRV